MKAGIAALVAGYMLSQFYRAFLAVLTPALGRDLGATAEDLGRASGLWFLAFAAMQLPVGWALDRIGPRRTVAVLLGIGGAGGAALFALAQGPGHVMAAMALIGVGCSPVLMASYYIFAREFSPRVFATLAGAVLGAGTLGNVAGSMPLALLVETFGWRAALAGMAVATLAVALAIGLVVRDPARLGPASPAGSLAEVLRLRHLWPILPLVAANYVPVAALRGVWAGPYAETVHGLDTQGIGWVTLGMGLAMIAGNFAYGPMDRLFGTRKWVVLAGNAAAGAACLTLAAVPDPGLVAAVALLAAIGFFGASFPLVMAHARAFIPPHLTGRGVTLVNLFSIGGAGVMQYASGPVQSAWGFPGLFLFLALPIVAGCLIYLFSRDTLG